MPAAGRNVEGRGGKEEKDEDGRALLLLPSPRPHVEAATTAAMLARVGGGGRGPHPGRRQLGARTRKRGPQPGKRQHRCGKEEAGRCFQCGKQRQCSLLPRCPCPIVPSGSRRGRPQLRMLRLVIQGPRRPRPCSRPSGSRSSRGRRRRLNFQSGHGRRRRLPRAVRRDDGPLHVLPRSCFHGSRGRSTFCHTSPVDACLASDATISTDFCSRCSTQCLC